MTNYSHVGVLTNCVVIHYPQDPEVMAAFSDIQANPANMVKYQNNPKVKKVMEKMAEKFGQGGAGANPGPGPF